MVEGFLSKMFIESLWNLCVAGISFANFLSNRTINIIRFEGDLIQTSEIQGESYFGSLSIVSPNFTYKSPNNA